MLEYLVIWAPAAGGSPQFAKVTKAFLRENNASFYWDNCFFHDFRLNFAYAFPRS